MKTIKIKTKAELEAYKASKTTTHLDMREWEGVDIDLYKATTGNIYLEEATTGTIDLSKAITGFIDLRKAKTGDINLRKAKTGDIYLKETTTGYIDLYGATTGDIDLTKATTVHINLKEATTGDIDLRGAEIRRIYLTEAKTGSIIQNYTHEDIELLKSIPYDKLNMNKWQSNFNWKQCKSAQELHTCGTTFCIRGYAEALYYVKNGKEIEDTNLLHPTLKHLFFMTNEQAKAEINKIILNYGTTK